MSVAELHERWNRHIDHIAEEANYMAIHLLRFQAIERWLWHRRHRRVVNRRLQAFDWISSLWIPVAHMYVRREIDGQRGTVNLKQLLHEMEHRPDAVVGITPSEIRADRKALEAKCSGVLEFANHQIAHRAYSDDPFSGGNFTSTFDAINDVLFKYFRVLTGTSLHFSGLELDPTWLIGFTEPWYNPRKKLRVRFD